MAYRHTTRMLLFYLATLAISFASPVTEGLDYQFGDTVQSPLSLSSGNGPSKSIAIVGAGSAGLAALKTLLDLPEDTRRGWEIVLYEQRRNVGGVWLPDLNEPHPPELPETPLYPLLRTNTPQPSMTYPGFVFPPFTPLYPNHKWVEDYHRAFADHFNLTSYIRLNHTVHEASWVGDSVIGKWHIKIERDNPNQLSNGQSHFEKSFDHLVVANGHNHYPYIPTWSGQDEWLANSKPGSPRKIFHSIFYRNPESLRNKTVIVVGGGASGRDIALQSFPVASKVFLSLRKDLPLPGRLPVPVERAPEISHFSAEAVHFVDDTSNSDIDVVAVGTGYEVRVPFLSRTGTLLVSSNDEIQHTLKPPLSTNLRYIYPLHEHIFSLCPSYPTNALAFVGLPALIANCPSDLAQGIIVAHAIANSSLLPPREEMLQLLAEREADLRANGYDPYKVGHRLVGENGVAHEYQDRIVRYVKDQGALPQDGKEFVEQWRRNLSQGNNSVLLWNGWMRIEQEGKESEKRWLEGVSTEDEWAELMYRIAEWEREQELEEGSAEDHRLGVWDEWSLTDY